MYVYIYIYIYICQELPRRMLTEGLARIPNNLPGLVTNESNKQ